MGKYIIINEQFTINDLDFNDNEPENPNIFSKETADAYTIYKHILKGDTVTDEMVDELD